MICPRCGYEMQEEHLYCERCGAEIQIVPDFEPEIQNSIEETHPVDRCMGNQSGPV